MNGIKIWGREILLYRFKIVIKIIVTEKDMLFSPSFCLEKKNQFRE